MSRPADLDPVRSPRRVLWAALFGAWGAILLGLLATGGMARYLTARNRPYLIIGGATLLAMAVVQWRRTLVPHGGDPEDDLHDVHCRCRRAEAPRLAEAVSVALFALPLVVWAAVPQAALGAQAARSRGVRSDIASRIPTAPPAAKPTPAASAAPATEGRRDLTILDVVYSTFSADYARKVGLEQGGTVEMIGLVVKGAPEAGDGFLLTRFLVTCCVADAVPIAVRATGPTAASAKDNTWVRVRGTIHWTQSTGVLKSTGRPFADVEVDRVDEIPVPSDPYLY